jgi:hypothetical protein
MIPLNHANPMTAAVRHFSPISQPSHQIDDKIAGRRNPWSGGPARETNRVYLSRQAEARRKICPVGAKLIVYSQNYNLAVVSVSGCGIRGLYSYPDGFGQRSIRTVVTAADADFPLSPIVATQRIGRGSSIHPRVFDA